MAGKTGHLIGLSDGRVIPFDVKFGVAFPTACAS
jgi:hypothetical protein